MQQHGSCGPDKYDKRDRLMKTAQQSRIITDGKYIQQVLTVKGRQRCQSNQINANLASPRLDLYRSINA